MVKRYLEEVVMAGAERTRDLSAPDRRTLLRMRQQLADQGYEMVPDQLIADLKTLDDVCRVAAGMSLVAFRDECALYDNIPPQPPYEAIFDDEAEAKEFARRVFEYYDLNYHVVPCHDGTCKQKFRLVSID